MSTKQIHVFISHAWSYSTHYQTLAGWIFDEHWSVGQASLNFLDYSIPRTNPIHNAINDNALKSAIFDKVARSHVVVIPTGMYVNYSKWIRKEIDGARQHRKPIIGVNPWGQLRKSSVVAAAAEKVVGWNKQPTINAIWELYKELVAAT
ncbi:MAG: TIR domain-containing protein [Alphaproteobacteria bacterium]|nr:TIR domain-containing protein [Alphaproteobacteria bacterium]